MDVSFLNSATLTHLSKSPGFSFDGYQVISSRVARNLFASFFPHFFKREYKVALEITGRRETPEKIQLSRVELLGL